MPSAAGNEKGLRILVQTPDKTWRRVAKILRYKYDPNKNPNHDGGFAISLPSHTGSDGHLEGVVEKTSVADSVTPGSPQRYHPPNNRRFNVSKEVKVSYHQDGHIHFSGTGIESGWDEDGTPKGLGIKATAFNKLKPLFLPGTTDIPTASCVFTMDMWGLDQFTPYNPSPTNSICISKHQLIQPFNVKIPSSLLQTAQRNGCALEVVMIPKIPKQALRSQILEGISTITAAIYRGPAGVECLPIQIIDLNHPAVMLGVTARMKTTTLSRLSASKSGFDCGTCVDKDGFELRALYPRPGFVDVPGNLHHLTKVEEESPAF
jgi:hypothetical protein